MSARADVDDLDLDLAGIDDGGNNKPSTWYDPDRYAQVYRASSVQSCSRMLQLTHAGVEGSPPPKSMLDRFRDGHLHEKAILAEIQAQRPGWKVHPTDPDTGLQYETELWVKEPDQDNSIPGIVIVGHTDGTAINRTMNPDSRICEAKALSKDNFEKFVKAWERGNVWDLYPYYRDSISVYMASLEVGVFYAVKNKNSGETTVFDLDEIPGDLDAIMSRIRVIDARAKRDHVDETCDRRSFPCFVAGTLVLTGNGYLPIEQVGIGDRVLTHKGRWRKVTGTRTDTRETRHVVARGGQVETTDNHPFLTRQTSLVHRSNNPNQTSHERVFTDAGWTFAEKLTKDHLVGTVLPRISSAADQWSEELWALAGRWVTDGWFASGHYSDGLRAPIIGCGYAKVDAFEDMVDATGLEVGRSDEPTVARYRFHRSDFTEMLDILDFGEYAHGKRIPIELLTARPGIVQAFLDGYLSGDGSLHPQGYWQASTVSEELAYGLSLLWQRVSGFVAEVSRNHRLHTTVIEGRVVSQRPEWIVRFSAGRGCWDVDDITWRRVRESTPTGRTETVYDIEVEQDESFIANGMIVHNCPMYRFHNDEDEGADPDAIMSAALGETRTPATTADGWSDPERLDKLCQEYDEFRASEKESGARKKETGVKIMGEFLLTDDKIQTENFTVKVKQHTHRYLDKAELAAFLEQHGRSLADFEGETQTEYPDVRRRKKQ